MMEFYAVLAIALFGATLFFITLAVKLADQRNAAREDLSTFTARAEFFEKIARQLRTDNKAERDRVVGHTIARAGLLRDALLLAALNRKLSNALEFYADEMGPDGTRADSNFVIDDSYRYTSGEIREINGQIQALLPIGSMAKRILKETNEVYTTMRKRQADEAANAK